MLACGLIGFMVGAVVAAAFTRAWYREEMQLLKDEVKAAWNAFRESQQQEDEQRGA